MIYTPGPGFTIWRLVALDGDGVATAISWDNRPDMLRRQCEALRDRIERGEVPYDAAWVEECR